MAHPESIAERIRHFCEECERRGIKLTHHRIEIFRELVSTEEHPDAEAVYHRVKDRIPTISLDTVYRNLRVLADHGLISVVGSTGERQRFDANISPHHHFMCVKCGAIHDFVSERLGTVKTPDEAAAFGEPISAHLEVRGVCHGCKERSRTQ